MLKHFPSNFHEAFGACLGYFKVALILRDTGIFGLIFGIYLRIWLLGSALSPTKPRSKTEKTQTRLVSRGASYGFIGVGRFRILGGPRGGGKFPAGT